jgi:hypothetical protein
LKIYNLILETVLMIQFSRGTSFKIPPNAGIEAMEDVCAKSLERGRSVESFARRWQKVQGRSEDAASWRRSQGRAVGRVNSAYGQSRGVIIALEESKFAAPIEANRNPNYWR